MKRRKIRDEVPEHTKGLVYAIQDIDVLMESHQQEIILSASKKPTDGDVVNDIETVFTRAAIILLCSAWEAFVEELALNGFLFLLKETQNPDSFPLEVRKKIASFIRDDKNELAPWKLAGDNWKIASTDFVKAEIKKLDSPLHENIEKLFVRVLGINDILDCWDSEEEIRTSKFKIVTNLVKIRGALAHGAKPEREILFRDVMYFSTRINSLAFLMSNHVLEVLRVRTNNSPWVWVQYRSKILDYIEGKVEFDPNFKWILSSPYE